MVAYGHLRSFSFVYKRMESGISMIMSPRHIFPMLAKGIDNSRGISWRFIVIERMEYPGPETKLDVRFSRLC
jgi:hypothetical protein